MAMGTRRRRQRQERIWIGHDEVAKGPGHPFYKKVNELLEDAKFDDFAEKECASIMAQWSKISNALKRLDFRSGNFLGQPLSETSRACTIRFDDQV
jgi:hypothetical protein